MEIQPELLKLGINEAIIEFFHNRTKNKHLIITKVTKAITIKNEKLDGIKVNVRLESKINKHSSVQYQQYTINVAKIRNKKLNLLLKK